MTASYLRHCYIFTGLKRAMADSFLHCSSYLCAWILVIPGVGFRGRTDLGS